MRLGYVVLTLSLVVLVHSAILNHTLPKTPILNYYQVGDLYPTGPIHNLTAALPNYTFGGVVQVGALQCYGLGITNTFAYQGFYSIQGWKFWEYVVNYLRDPPGISLNGSRWAVNVTVINVAFNDADMIDIANKTFLQKLYGEYHIFIAPWSTAKTLNIAPFAEMVKIPFLAPWAAVENAFLCDKDWAIEPPCTASGNRRFQYMWGLITTGDVLWDSAINLLKLKGASTIGLWALNDSFSLNIIVGAEAAASRNALVQLTPSVSNHPADPLSVLAIGANYIPDINLLRKVFARLQSLDPDIVICGNRVIQTCTDIVVIMNSTLYAPKAIAVSQCISVDEIYRNNDMRYFLDYSFWDPTVHGISFTDSPDQDWPPTNGLTSSSYFNRTFSAYTGNPANYYSATCYISGYAIEAAIAKAKSLDPEILNSVFPYNLETTFWGTLGYNGFGWNDKGPNLVVQRDDSGDLKIVYPSGTATNDIVYPFVSWQSRAFKSTYLEYNSEIVMFAIYIALLIFTIVCFGFLFMHWTARAIVASSPIFLSIMLVGSVLLYSTVPAWMVYTDEASCHLRIWFLNLGFTLLFGTLTAKTHRIKTLFLLKKMRPKKFSDKKLSIIVLVLVAIDVLLCILWSAITEPKIKKQVTVIAGSINGQSDGRLWENLNYNECSWGSDDTALKVFYALEGTYKSLMVCYGLYLSRELWKYGSSMWVESKQIIFSMYNLIVFALIGLALQLSLSNNSDQTTREVLFATRSMCVFISGFITIVVILIPRLLDPEGKGHEGKDATGTKRTIDTAAVQLSDLEWKYEILEKKYKELKSKLKQSNPDMEVSAD